MCIAQVRTRLSQCMHDALMRHAWQPKTIVPLHKTNVWPASCFGYEASVDMCSSIFRLHFVLACILVSCSIVNCLLPTPDNFLTTQ